ncbi:MAG: glycoside hydrolase family 3 N-terminal domain-containing protein [Pseudomonadota bacterium]
MSDTPPKPSALSRREALALGLGAASALAVGTAPAEAASLEAMVGSLLILGLPGSSTGQASAKALARNIAAGRVGGVVMLKHNVRSKAGVTDLTRMFSEAGAEFLSIDQEGGAVQRLSSKFGFSAIPRARNVAKLSPAEARDLYARAAREIKAVGFNLNLAPVVDLHSASNPIIGKYGRAYGADPAVVAQYAAAFVDAHRRAGVGCTLKHFPGHGTSRGDSHDGAVDITRTWDATELQPFQQLVRSGHADAIMLGHLYHRDLSDGGEPITLSRTAIEGLLRRRLGFKGVVVTDDLDMGAIRRRHPPVRASVMALAAGADMIMASNSAKPDNDLPARIIDGVGEAIAKGQLSERRIRQAYDRVRRFSRAYAV